VRQVVLLRGINLGAHNRIAMPDLRQLLAGAGFEDARTYVQSGNVVLSSDETPERLARECERHIAEGLGLEVEAIARTLDELAELVRRDPLGHVAINPKRYQVSFLTAEADPDTVRGLAALAGESERFVAIGREFYAWHPEGVARSRLGTALASRRLGVTATSRNWTTVTNLLALADE
jgi:uncharacterized protein (DUF1697 family)